MRAFFTLSVAGILSVASAQTLFVEDFESSPAFVLNTTDANSTVGITNTWSVNTVYAGGSGTVDCLGFPLDFSIGATPGQPGGVSSPNGNYLHTASLVAISNGIQCCSFGAADGFCTNADDIFAAMSTDVSTVGSSEVSLSFWWLCNGGVQNYGEVWYSTNGGGSWAQLTVPITQYRGQTGWVEQTASIPAFGNQATLRFGFRFHNGQSFAGGSDPGFAIDDVRIIASAASTIATGTAPVDLCEGSGFNLPYTISGNYLPGNSFTVQLSDASGDFGGAIAIGSLVSTTAGSIPCTIPPGTPAGTGYRVRVISSAPAVVGADNGADITIDAAPIAGADATISLCAGDDPIALETGGDAGGSWSGPSAVVDGLFDPVTMLAGEYVYTVLGSGACSASSAVLSISVSPGSNAGSSAVALICKNTGLYELFSFLGGSPDAGGTWEGPDGSPFSGSFNSDNGTPGIYTYTVDNGGACPSDDAVITVQLGEPGLAGPDALWTVCSSDMPVDLFNLLENANTTGIWFSGMLPFNGIAEQPGTFFYIDFAQQPCPSDTAVIQLVVNAAADAGDNATSVVCTTDPSVDLFDLLGGAPQVGGTWTAPDGATISPVLVPATAASGLYTYVVEGLEPCADDLAVLAVLFDDCTAVDELHDGQGLVRWSGPSDKGTTTFMTPVWEKAFFRIMDVRGRVVRAWDGNTLNGMLQVETGSLATGVHVLQVISAERSASVRFMP